MESALYGIYALVVFVSEILLVRCAHSFDFWYVNNLCVNTVRQHFPWSILYVTFEGGARSRGIGSNYENYWLDLIRRTIKSYRIVNQLFTATGFEDNKFRPTIFSITSTSSWIVVQQPISELPQASVSKRGQVQSHWCEIDFLFLCK